MKTINYLTKDEANFIEKDISCVWEKFTYSTLTNLDIVDFNVDNKVSTILCYSIEHLYIFIKSNQTSLINNDRSYQNGDGFHFVLAKPNESLTATDEFYVIAIRPLADNRLKNFIWYHNVDFIGKILEKTKTSHVISTNGITFMVKIPWAEISPLQPFLYDTYGFNVRYVQSVPKGKNLYTLKEDSLIDSEQSLREYVVYHFEIPTTIKDIESVITVDKKHVTKGQEAFIEYAVTVLNKSTLLLSFTNKNRLIVEKSIALEAGLNRLSIPIDTTMLELGHNDLHILTSIDTNASKSKFSLYYYDLKHYIKLNQRIADLTKLNILEDFLKESIITLMFYGQHLLDEIENLKPYHSFLPIEEACLSLEKKVTSVEAKKHIFEINRCARFAYQSDLDQSLQPYTLYVPTSINESTRLLVYLHGSGSDDTSVKSASHILDLAKEQNLIVLAPYGRGTSHFYCTDESRKDVTEITKKIASLYHIDHSNIILSGFSMGGYGVYRLYDEDPSLFSKLIILSGHHGIGQYFGGPNYGLDDNIKRFTSIPMIIFHGTADQNCSFKDSAPFFNKLQRINSNVVVNVKEGLGHSGLTDDWHDILSDWLSVKTNKQ